MKKWIIVCVLLVSVCVLFSGCAEEPAQEVNAVVLSEVRDAVLQGLDAEMPFMIETDALLDLYGIEGQWVASSAGFVTMNGTFPDEIILVEAVDANAAQMVREKLENRLAEVLVQSKTYDAENYAAAQACTVRVDGCYVSLILSPEYQQVSEIYETCLYKK